MHITRGIHALKIPFEVPLPGGVRVPRYVYVYALLAEDSFLIDSGVAGSCGMILSYLEKQGIVPPRAAQLLLTHSHPDHIGSAAELRTALHCEVAAHAAEKCWIEDVSLQKSMRPVPGFDTLVEGPVKVDRILNDGASLNEGSGLALRVLHTPGHSPGSISFCCEEAAVVFSGDAVPQPGSMPIYEDAAASAHAIRRLMALRDAQFLLSSWDAPREGAEVQAALLAGLAYLREIHAAVKHVMADSPALDEMELCRKAVAKLGLPPFAVNPLVARSFRSHAQLIAQAREDELSAD